MERATGRQNISTVTYTYIPRSRIRKSRLEWASKSNGLYEYTISIFIFPCSFFHEFRNSIYMATLSLRMLQSIIDIGSEHKFNVYWKS